MRARNEEEHRGGLLDPNVEMLPQSFGDKKVGREDEGAASHQN